MNRWRNLILNLTLIIIGIGCSTWIISTDGNGQNALPVAAGMLFVSLITGMISFVIGRFVPALPISIFVSIIVTDLLFVLYLISLSAFKPKPHPHGNEELILLPIIFVVETTPTVVFAAIGFGRLGRYLRKGRNSLPPRHG